MELGTEEVMLKQRSDSYQMQGMEQGTNEEKKKERVGE